MIATAKTENQKSEMRCRGHRVLCSRAASDGFSLAEVLIAVAILTIALVMVGVSFPVGVMMTTNVAERTTAAVVADEAFAKIRIYGVNISNPNWDTPRYIPPGATRTVIRQVWLPFEKVAASAVPEDEFLYPSDPDLIHNRESIYCWSALCRREVDSTGTPTGLVRVVVFVNRRTGPGTNPLYPTTDPAVPVNRIPKATLIFDDYDNDGIFSPSADDRLVINTESQPADNVVNVVNRLPFPPADPGRQAVYLNPGCFVLDDDTSEIYRVIERTETASARMVMRAVSLDRKFQTKYEEPGVSRDWRCTYKFWVVPPPVGGGRNPCIAVYQKVMKF